MAESLESLEKTVLGDEHDLYSFPNSQDRVEAVQNLEHYGLLGLGVIGSYWMKRGHFDVEDPCPDVEEKIKEVESKILGKYSHLNGDNRGFVREVAKEALGYGPRDDEVLSKEKYERIYSTVHAVVFPAMVMGRIDCNFVKSDCSYKERTLGRLLNGIDTLSSIFRKDSKKSGEDL